MTTQTPTPADFAAALDSVEIFRPGRHVAMSGQVIEFTAAHVAAIAEGYDPAVHEAPHVVGHPRTDGPAYGWVQGLGVNEAGRLCVTASRQVEPAFAELVADGRFKKRSASFYPPDHPGNPKPGAYYLKHVGWLGAAAPAVKGLADPESFSQAEDGLVEFSGWDDEINAGMWRRMREWFIAQFGTETADRVLPAYEVDALQREAMRPAPEEVSPSPTAAYAEGDPAVSTADPNSPAALAALRADLDARAARIAEQEAAQAALTKSARTAGIAAFADQMVGQGRLLPGERGAIVALADALPDSIEVIEFAEGDPAKPVKRTPLEVLQGFLKALPPRVEFAELAGAARTAPGTVDLADANAIGAAAQEFVQAEHKAGRVVSIEAAVQHVVTKHKES